MIIVIITIINWTENQTMKTKILPKKNNKKTHTKIIEMKLSNHWQEEPPHFINYQMDRQIQVKRFLVITRINYAAALCIILHLLPELRLERLKLCFPAHAAYVYCST